MKILSLSLCILLIISECRGQYFTKVISGNPIVQDSAHSGGGSWVDVNNDNLPDLFVSNGNLVSDDNFLYLNTGNGNFIKVTNGSIVTDGGSSIGSAWGDYNEDGFSDCFVTNRNNYGNFFYEGTGDTIFNKITSGQIVTDHPNSNSSSWVDIDNDGDIDLYTVNFMANDVIYFNQGPPFFNLIKDSTHLTVTDAAGFSIPAAWCDYNNDRLPDLFKGYAGLQNDRLYTNNGNLSFLVNIMTDARSTLGCSWGDYDNDGDMDLFAAGYQMSGNLLYNNSGYPNYNLTMIDTGIIAEQGNCVGSAWGDIDNDGDADLFVSNDGASNFLYINDGPPFYTFHKEVVDICVNDSGASFGVSFCDYDMDGALDLFVANRQSYYNFLYHNNGNINNWTTIKCVGVHSNTSAIGTKIYIKATINGIPTWQLQEVTSQSGYNSQSQWLHFGLGDAAMIDTLIAVWPSGLNDTCTSLGINSQLTIMEGQCSGVTGLPERKSFKYSLFPNPAKEKVKLILNYKDPSKDALIVRISDFKGEILKEIKMTMKDAKEGIDISDFPDGIFIFELKQGNNIGSQLLLISKED